MTIERKTFTLQVESVDDDQGIITGYLSTFGNVDLGNGYIRDRVMAGAFKRTINSAMERKASKDKKYLWPHLWFHNPEQPIGGYVDAREDAKGLLVTYQLDISTNAQGVPNNPLATMVFSGYKSGYIDEQSIGYEVLKSEMVDEVVDGKKTMVRNLIELRLYEGSSITSNFAMNPEATVVSIKAASSSSDDTVTTCGNTTGPIGPRQEAWDGGKAEDQIWSVAYDDDTSTVDTKLAAKYFMTKTGDGSNKGDWGYPFWYVSDSPHICVGAVIAIAAAIQGSRGANAPDALKPKIESLYKRITAKFPDDPPLMPPWESDDTKGAAMPKTTKAGTPPAREKKTFAEHYAEEMCEDQLEDWCDVILCSLTKSVYDAFTIGDQPEADVRDALAAFNDAVMDWVAKGVQYGLSTYIESQDGFMSGSTLSLMQGGDDSPYYGYMSRPMHGETKAAPFTLMLDGKRLGALMAPHLHKAMTESDATTGGFTADQVEKLKKASTKAMKATADHADALHGMADKVTGMLDAAKKSLAQKTGAQFSQANASALQDHADGLHDMADKMVSTMTRQTKAINTVADDLATILQGSEAAYGTDPGDAGDRQEGKSAPYPKRTRATEPPPSNGDTATEEELSAALAQVKSLRTNSSIPTAA